MEISAKYHLTPVGMHILKYNTKSSLEENGHMEMYDWVSLLWNCLNIFNWL